MYSKSLTGHGMDSITISDIDPLNYYVLSSRLQSQLTYVR